MSSLGGSHPFVNTQAPFGTCASLMQGAHASRWSVGLHGPASRQVGHCLADCRPHNRTLSAEKAVNATAISPPSCALRPGRAPGLRQHRPRRVLGRAECEHCDKRGHCDICPGVDASAVPRPPRRRRLARQPAARRRRGDTGLPRPPARRRGRAIERLFRGRLLAAALELPARPGHRPVPARGPALGAPARLGEARRPQALPARRDLRCAVCARCLAALAAPDDLPGLLPRAPVRHGNTDVRPLVQRTAHRPGGVHGLARARRGRVLRRAAPGRRELVVVGDLRRRRVPRAARAGGAGGHRPALQHLQAGGRRARQERGADHGACQRRAGRQHLRVRRVAADDTGQRQRQRHLRRRRRSASTTTCCSARAWPRSAP